MARRGAAGAALPTYDTPMQNYCKPHKVFELLEQGELSSSLTFSLPFRWRFEITMQQNNEEEVITTILWELEQQLHSKARQGFESKTRLAQDGAVSTEQLRMYS